ncbi:exonuclease [Dactylosporangium aurantiacum]|uniref:Exonuclease n=1 Tax=Dactylosporangium aurantiacum TaxID=35754 RepID=A0A9Q9IGZ6_9ACTN|nr:exonuclease [Dactylosporangium aurantiacum]MDG6110218.1 exonuclease [Dactylosporangium aurantiacum]UWZ55501.1 exonuclease [Dactylosporangium aurantiacum]
MRADVYFSLDVEADGPIPGPYSMVSVGLAVAGRSDGVFAAADPTADTFYRELRPISDDFVPEALAVSGLDRAALLRDGADPAVAMAELSAWVTRTAGAGRPVVVAYPAVFDWMFLYWYLLRFTGASVFGHSGCLDIKTLYAVRAGVPIGAAVKGRMPAHLLSKRRHTHHALDDAVEQAELFANLMTWRGPQ